MPEDQKVSEKQLAATLWYVKHRGLLRGLVLGGIILVDAVLVLYAVFGAGRDLFMTRERRAQEQELLRSDVSLQSQAAVRVVDLQLRGVELIRVGEVTDVVARVQNPNPDFYARFSYTIGLGNQTQTFDDGFIFPAEEGIFVQSIRASSGTVVFTIDRVSWRRINPKEIPDFSSFRAERLNFEVVNTQFLPAALEGKGNVSRLTFTLINHTGYSYVAPKFLALLQRGSRLIAIQSTIVDQFRSGEAREITLSWFDRVGAISVIEVVPVIDILDPQVYLKP